MAKTIDYLENFMGEYNDHTNEVLHEIFKSGAQKETQGKLRMDLIPPEADKAYAETLTYGAGKYADRNWEKGIPFMAAVAALKRHLNAWELGEDVNEESGLNHMKHVEWWANALVVFIERGRKDLDNRPSKEK